MLPLQATMRVHIGTSVAGGGVSDSTPDWDRC